MEKRLLIAFVLSFLVLTTWSAMTAKQHKPSASVSTFDNKANTEEHPISNSISNQAGTAELAAAIPAEPLKSFPEKIAELKNDKLSLEFSSRGGSLKKATINHLDTYIPLKRLLGLKPYDQKEFRMDRVDNNTIVYSLNDNGLRITRTYTLNENDYIVQSKVSIKNETNSIISLNKAKTIFEINFQDEMKNHAEWMHLHGRDQSLFEYVVYSQSGISRKNNAYKFNAKEEKSLNEKVDWIAFRTRYTCAIIKPNFATDNYKIVHVDDNTLDVKIDDNQAQIGPGQEISQDFTMYFGPEDTKILKSYGLEFEKIKRFYRWALFDVPAKLIYWLLHFIHGFISNWGVCIMIIATVIYGLTYPLTIKSMTSMKKLQQVSPRITALKEKYKDNPQRLNKEMMEIYKAEKINPLAGCIPVLLQMPVFIGLYQVLWRDPSFKGASFLWMKDLTLPDRLIPKLPLVGFELNILPLLMCVIMFVQQTLTTKNMTFADKDQETQQKMMAKIMPLVMGFIFYGFASGINLYFTLFYLYSAITQLKMSKVKNV